MNLKIEKSSSQYYALKSIELMLEHSKQNLRDLGKVYAFGAELYVKDWLNDNVDLLNMTREHEDKNESGYDLIDTNKNFRVQCKIRSKEFHLEQTRRKSKKNENSSATGHVCYAVGECDVFVFIRPDAEDYGNINKWEIVVIPEYELHDSNNPNYLVPRIGKKITDKYRSLTKEEKINLIKECYESV